MSAFEKPADMIARSKSIAAATIYQLDIPPKATKPEPVQPCLLMLNDGFHLLSPCKRFYAHLIVSMVVFDPLTNVRSLLCRAEATGEPVTLDDQQLALLERARRLRILKPNLRGLPKSPASMNEIEIAIAERNRGYVQMAETLAWEEGRSKPTEGTFARAIGKYAKQINDLVPITTKTVRKYWMQSVEWREEDLRAFLPRKSAGNTKGDFSTELEEFIKTCVIVNWSLGRPSLKTLKELMTDTLLLPEYGELAKVSFDGKGNLVPSDPTLYRRMAELNQYDKDRELHGPEGAVKKRRKRANNRLPPMCLDIVDVDYTELNVVVYDPRFHHVYGRPKLIVFRDRKSGSILGFSVFFENPSFEAVWHGMRRMMFPKDMSRYPKWKWLMYGFPRIIVVDNDSTLISEAVKAFCAALGIIVRQARVYRPTDKSGVEQFFAKLDIGVILNLPGSTGKNPDDKNKFDDEKNKGVPFIDVATLDAAIVQYICLEVHARPLDGFLRGAQTSEEIWAGDIAKTKQRPLFDPEELLRIGGFRIKVTIRGGNTIVWKEIQYFSYDLGAASEDPRHVDGKTVYDGWVDPSDLGTLYIINHWDNGSLIEVPASPSWASYANGRRLFQHLITLKHHAKVSKTKIESVSDIERSSKRMASAEQKRLIERVTSQKVKEQYAAAYGNLAERTVLGTLVDTPSSAAASRDFLDPENPMEVPPTHYSETAAPSSRTPRSPPEVFVDDGNGNLIREDVMAGSVEETAATTEATKRPPTKTGKRDIEALRKMHKGWD